MPIEEVRGIIALTREQVVRGPERKPSITELINEGAEIVSLVGPVDLSTRLFPIGTAAAACFRIKMGRDYRFVLTGR